MDKVGKEASSPSRTASRSTTSWTSSRACSSTRLPVAYFINNPDRQIAILEDPFVLLHDKKVSNIRDLLPVLEQVAKPAVRSSSCRGRRRRGARDPGGEQPARHPEDLRVKAPGFGDRRKAMLEDIAILTGGTVIAEELGLKLENVTLKDLARPSPRSKETPRSSTAPARKTRSRPRDHHPRPDRGATSDYDKEKLQERVAS